MSRTAVGVIGLTLAAFVSAPGLAAAETFDGAYRGMIVCEKLNTSQFMLRAPFDIMITGKTAVAARPIFNRQGTFVVGNEIATGTVGDDGEINWCRVGMVAARATRATTAARSPAKAARSPARKPGRWPKASNRAAPAPWQGDSDEVLSFHTKPLIGLMVRSAEWRVSNHRDRLVLRDARFAGSSG